MRAENEERTILGIKLVSRTVKYGIRNETELFIYKYLLYYPFPQEANGILLIEPYSIKRLIV